MGAALSRKASKEIPRIPPEKWPLHEDLNRIMSYECLLFSTSMLRDTNETEKDLLLQVIRPSLGISMKKHSAIVASITVCSHEFSVGVFSCVMCKEISGRENVMVTKC